MDKREFLDRLSACCGGLPEEEKRRTLDYYSEMIDDGVEAGQREEEAVAALGEPAEIAARLREAVGETREEERERSEVSFSVETLRLIEIRSRSDDVALAPAEDGVCRLVWDENVSDWNFIICEDSLLAEQQEREGPRGFAGLLRRLSSGKATLYLPRGEYEELLVTSASGDFRAPAGWRFRRASVRAASGDVEFSSEVGELRLETRSGDIAGAYEGGESLTVSALSGDVRLNGQRLGSLSVSSASGDIELEALGAESLELHSMSGDLALRRVTVTGPLSLEAKSGDITFTEGSAGELAIRALNGDIELSHCRAFGKAALETLNGDVTLRVFDAQELQISTTNGDVDAELLSPKRFDVRTKLGEASAPDSDPAAGRCEIRAMYGDIKVRLV